MNRLRRVAFVEFLMNLNPLRHLLEREAVGELLGLESAALTDELDFVIEALKMQFKGRAAMQAILHIDLRISPVEREKFHIAAFPGEHVKIIAERLRSGGVLFGRKEARLYERLHGQMISKPSPGIPEFSLLALEAGCREEDILCPCGSRRWMTGRGMCGFDGSEHSKAWDVKARRRDMGVPKHYMDFRARMRKEGRGSPQNYHQVREIQVKGGEI